MNHLGNLIISLLLISCIGMMIAVVMVFSQEFEITRRQPPKTYVLQDSLVLPQKVVAITDSTITVGYNLKSLPK